MWYEHAKPGDKVVCIKEPPDIIWKEPPPQVNSVYTIKYTMLRPWPGRENCQIFLLLEGYQRLCWVASCFRPVQSTETGMSILRQLLKEPHYEFES